MKTITQQIQQEISTMPSNLLEEALNYIISLKKTISQSKEVNIKDYIIDINQKKENTSEIFNEKTKQDLKQSENEIKKGNVYSFDNSDNALTFLDKIIEEK